MWKVKEFFIMILPHNFDSFISPFNKLLYIQKLPGKKMELGQILHNCCSEARLVTKCCKFNRQLFEARNMTDLLTVSGNNHLLLEMLFAQLKIEVYPFQKCRKREFR